MALVLEKLRTRTLVYKHAATALFLHQALIDEFMSTSDLDRARELIFEAQLILAEDRPYITLFYKQTIDLARDNLFFPYTESLGGLEYASGLQTSVVPLSR